MSSKPKPKLHDDILIIMVEKMFFQKPEGDGFKAIDLRKENPYTFFMAHKPITETAFITQFAKLRQVQFQNVKDHNRTIEFYKDEKNSVTNQQNALFTGPWLVSNMLMEEIIRRKKLRVTNVSTYGYLQNREACDLGTNASSLEAFCTLFLGKKHDITNSMKNDYNLEIKKLVIQEEPEDIKNNFEAIHAINSKELAFINSEYEDLFSVCSSLPRQITTDKTIKISIDSGVVEIDKFVISNAMNYANFVIETCPNLTMLHFDINTFPNYGDNAIDYLDKLSTILTSFMNEFLKPLDKGHSELKICLTWHCDCKWDVYEDFPQDHELFTLGIKFTPDDEDPYWGTLDTARIIKVADAKGRKHECILKILIEDDIDENRSELVSNQDSSDDDSDEDSADFDDYSDIYSKK